MIHIDLYTDFSSQLDYATAQMTVKMNDLIAE